MKSPKTDGMMLIDQLTQARSSYHIKPLIAQQKRSKNKECLRLLRRQRKILPQLLITEILSLPRLPKICSRHLLRRLGLVIAIELLKVVIIMLAAKSEKSPPDMERTDGVSKAEPKSDVPEDASRPVDHGQPILVLRRKTRTSKRTTATRSTPKFRLMPRDYRDESPTGTAGSAISTDEVQEYSGFIDPLEACRDVRCMIEFMDDTLRPVLDRLYFKDSCKVYHDDLRHILNPGISCMHH